jgi:small subunit ribosomal protein S3
MGMNSYFVKQSIKEASIEDFIKQNFPSTDFSQIELQRTPLGIKIIIHTHKPGRVIGRSGSKINRMSDMLKEKFELDNPQLDVKSVPHPDLDPRIVAKQIKISLEKGFNFKKIGNVSLKRIMDAGALGAEIVISGKLGGSKGRTGKFMAGYIKHCGDSAEKFVDFGFEEALTKPGKIGIRVKIMKEFRDITGKIVRKAYAEDTRVEKRHEKAPSSGGSGDMISDGGSLDFDYTEEKKEAAPEAEEKAKAAPAAEGKANNKKAGN